MKRIRRWLWEWLCRRCQVGECAGVLLVEFWHCEEFAGTIVEAMKLVERTDPRRFDRVKQRIKWIVNKRLFRAGAIYGHATRTCFIDFHRVCDWDSQWAVGWCALLLVHEATHGLIHDRGVPYTRRLRSRVERLCVKEEQRFVARLAKSQPETAGWLKCEFNEAGWAPSWNATRVEKLAWLWAQIAVEPGLKRTRKSRG
jgi:hypothetical protein